MNKLVLLIALMFITINAFSSEECQIGATTKEEHVKVEIADISYHYVGDAEYKYCTYGYNGFTSKFDCSTTSYTYGDLVSGELTTKCTFASTHVPRKILRVKFTPYQQ